VCGEGCFHVTSQKYKNKIGFQVRLNFSIVQHERNLKLKEVLKNFLGSGKIYKDSRGIAVVLTFVRFKDLIEKIIHLFSKTSYCWNETFRFSRLIHSCEINEIRKTSKTGWLI